MIRIVNKHFGLLVCFSGLVHMRMVEVRQLWVEHVVRVHNSQGTVL